MELARIIWVIYLQAQGLSGLLLILVCGTLYAHRRRAYFLYWTLAWFVFSLWRLFSGLAMGEHWLAPAGAPGHVLLRYIASVCGWWHVSLWVLGLLDLRRIYLIGLSAPVPGAAESNAAQPTELPGRVALSWLLLTVGLAVLVQMILPNAAQAVLSAVMAIMYGASAAWFAARWWRTGQLGALMLPVSLGLCALARLYSATLAPNVAAEPIPLPVLYNNALIDFLLQTFTVVAMIVVLLGDEDALLREAGQRLAESEERFRLLFEYGGVGMALLSPDGDFVQANPALVQMLGYSAAELLGKHLTDVLFDEDKSSSTRLKQKADSPQYEREKRFLHRDERIVWARIVRVPVRDARGEIRYHATIFVDVTERKRAEEALAASEQRMRLRFQQAFDGICLWSPSGMFLDANPALCRLLDRDRDELLGRPVAEVADDPEAMRGHLRAVLERSGARCETRLLPRGGGFVDVEVNSAVLEVENQRLILGICRDISARKQAEAQLARARKMETLNTLVGGIAHDFNNQLAAILGNLDLVRGDLEKSRKAEGGIENELQNYSSLEELLPCVRDAERAGQRCARMTARLLTFSRGRLGVVQTIALDQLLGETVRALQHELPDIEIVVRTAPGVWPVSADVAQVQELLLNLATNARDAMPQGGTLTLSLANRAFRVEDCAADLERRPGSFVELCVSDTGRGMTPEVRERIFEPFFTTKRPGQGAGMGLSVVFGIVKGHKGWISVRSQPGEGSAFYIYLPVVEARVPALPAPKAEPAVPAAQGRILVVDDESLLRDLARTVLERWGFQVQTADSGEEALDIYRRQHDAIDLILLDYTMPRMNGVQVLKELLHIKAGACVVFSSGFSTDHDVDQLLAAGARGFVPKPYRPQDLVQTIRQALARGKTMQLPASSP